MILRILASFVRDEILKDSGTASYAYPEEMRSTRDLMRRRLFFVRKRVGVLAEHLELKKKLHEIELRLSRGFAEHEQELREIRFLIAQLEKPAEITRRRIGYSSDTEG